MRKSPAKIERYQEKASWKLFESGYEAYESGKYRKAAELYKRSASLGEHYAQVNLGCMYDVGEGVKQDKKIAAHYFKLAYHNGSAIGAYNLGMYYRDEGATRWAEYWFKIALGMGGTDAKRQLAALKRTSLRVHQSK